MDFIQIFLFFILIMSIQSILSPRKKLPPSPRKVPIIGNLHQLLGDLPHISLQKLSTQYGPLMFLQLGSIPTLVISSADVAREILLHHDLIFSSRPQLYSPKKLSYGFNDISFAPYGEYWREVRKITILELLSHKRVNSFSSVREEEVQLVIDSIARCASGMICSLCFGVCLTQCSRALDVIYLTSCRCIIAINF